MNEAQRNKTVIIFALILSAIVLLVGLTVMNFSVKEELAASTCQTLGEIMEQQAYNFSSKVEDHLAALSAITEIFPFGEVSDDETKRLLQGILKGLPFAGVSVADKNGKAFSSEGVHFDVSDRTYFQKVMQTGKPSISAPLASKLSVPGQSSVVLMGVPIIRNGETVGVFIAANSAGEFDKLFLPSFNNKGYAYVTTNDGHIVAKTTNSYSLTNGENLFFDWNKADFFFGDNLETIKRNLYANKSGHAGYDFHGNRRRMHYTTIPTNEWNIFSIVPEEVSTEIAGKISSLVNMMTLVFILVFGLLVYWLLSMQTKHVKLLSHIAYVDELTGAPTLAKFKIEAQKLVDENLNKKYLMVKCDIDRFKLVNQVLGFAEGDRILKNVARALGTSISSDTSDKEVFAKVNTDEFVLLHEYHSEEHLFKRRQLFLDTFQELMGEDFTYNMIFPMGYYHMKTSEGISLAIEKTNAAHRKAKSSGQEVCVYDEEIIKEAIELKNLENHADTALKNSEFKVFLQPKYYLSDETIAGAEALVRWKFQDTELIYPGKFIPLFEQNGFISKLDMYMFEKTCELMKEWIDKKIAPVVVSVNFSRNHLINPNFVSELCLLTDKYNLPRRLLEIEITETAIFDNEYLMGDVLYQLHEKGFTLSMDDFGTGYSSLGLLKNIPVDVLKIDRGFFTDSKDEERANTVISNVIRMAKELKIKTVAEGVEIKEHIELLRGFGCDIVQGYYYSKPMPAEEFTAKITK